MKENREEYQNEKEKREKRLLAYADMIQSAVQQDSSEVIRQLVEERKRQRLTQQELSDITGVRTSNIARFEGGTRIPTLLMLEKYANALGKHIEVSIHHKRRTQNSKKIKRMVSGCNLSFDAPRSKEN